MCVSYLSLLVSRGLTESWGGTIDRPSLKRKELSGFPSSFVPFPPSTLAPPPLLAIDLPPLRRQISLLIPVRLFVVPKLGFTADELAILDGPVAAEFSLRSVGGSI